MWIGIAQSHLGRLPSLWWKAKNPLLQKGVIHQLKKKLAGSFLRQTVGLQGWKLQGWKLSAWSHCSGRGSSSEIYILYLSFSLRLWLIKEPFVMGKNPPEIGPSLFQEQRELINFFRLPNFQGFPNAMHLLSFPECNYPGLISHTLSFSFDTPISIWSGARCVSFTSGHLLYPTSCPWALETTLPYLPSITLPP